MPMAATINMLIIPFTTTSLLKTRGAESIAFVESRLPEK